MVAVGLTLAGCGDDEPEDPFAATTTAPILLGEDAVSTTTTATTTPPTAPPLGADPFAVPATADAITETYVEAVLNELSRLDGDALRMAFTEGLVTQEALAILEEVFAAEYFQLQVDSLVADANAGFPGIAANPGDRLYNVEELLVARTDCVAAVVNTDFSEVVVSAPPPRQLHVELLRGESRLDDLNPTVWQIGRSVVVTPEMSDHVPCG